MPPEAVFPFLDRRAFLGVGLATGVAAQAEYGAINRFGRGVERAQLTLAKNGSPPAEFEFGDTFFGVTIKARP